jgi:phosphatidylglycerophosphate synthase
VNTALILPPTAASFRPIGGLPLIQRTVLSALRSGFERVIVMPGNNGARLQQLFSTDPRTRRVELADQPPARLIREGQVALIPGDCLVTSATLNRVYDTRVNGRPVVFTHGASGENLVLCHAAALSQLEDLLEQSASARRARLQEMGEPSPDALGDDLCVHVTDESSARVAEDRLLAQLRSSTADSDGPLARWIDRSVSQWISRRLVYTPLRPNHITIIGTTIGLLAAWCIAQGAHTFAILGTLLFLCATVIDGVDGEVARLKFQETPFGHKFDIFTDNVVHVAIFTAVAIGQFRRYPEANYPLLIGLFLVGLASAMAAASWCFLREPQALRQVAAPRTTKGRVRRVLLRGFESLMNRDFAYVLFALAIIDRLQWFFWGCVFGTYLFSAGLLWIYRWRDAA